MTFYFLYKTTNLINGKIYFGVHTTANINDGYLGSGTQLIRAITKYGKENFHREIIAFFNSIEEAYECESQVVTKEFVKEDTNYNIKPGGIGGFFHINSLVKSERPNVIKIQEMKEANEITWGGQSHYSQEAKTKMKAQALENLRKNNEVGIWNLMSEEKANERKAKLVKEMTGRNNPKYGTTFYIDKDYKGILPNITILNKLHRFKLGEQPENWISLNEWRDLKKNKKNSAYGRHWYNNGEINFYLYPDDEKCINLKKGRLVKKPN